MSAECSTCNVQIIHELVKQVVIGDAAERAFNAVQDTLPDVVADPCSREEAACPRFQAIEAAVLSVAATLRSQ